MIPGFFLSIFLVMLQFFVNLFPVVAYPTQITSAVNFIWGYINAVNFLFPVSTLLTILGLALTYHVAVFLWRASNWLYAHIPFKMS